MSSRSLNKVTLIGNLTRDPELRYTPSGTAVCTFGLATNRSWLPEGATERKEETEFHRIVAWNKLAELCSQLLAKGRKVFVEGRLSTRTFTGQDGMQRTITEIVIDDMIILDSRKAFEEAGGSLPRANYQQAPTTYKQTSPSTTQNSSSAPLPTSHEPVVDVQTEKVGVPATVETPVAEPAEAEEESGKKKKKTTKTSKADVEGTEKNIEPANPSGELNTDDIPF